MDQVVEVIGGQQDIADLFGKAVQLFGEQQQALFGLIGGRENSPSTVSLSIVCENENHVLDRESPGYNDISKENRNQS